MLPMTVAMAAPAAPIPRALIKMGSRMILTMDPIMEPTIASEARPSVLRRFVGTSEKMITDAPRAIQV